MPTDAINGDMSKNDQIELNLPRLLPDVVSHHAQHDPEKVWASLPLHATDASKGYEDINFSRLAYGVDRAARWIESTLGPATGNFEPLAYLGPPDSRYVIFVLASIKTGYQMLFLSTRNSDEAQYHVMKQAKCRTFICATPMQKRVEDLIRNWPSDSEGELNGDQDRSKGHRGVYTKIFTAPEQHDLLRDEPVAPFPYGKTVEEARRDPLVVLHTSSTTGMPKTIHLNQGYGLHEDIMQQIPRAGTLDIITRKPFYGPCRMFVAMPLFHAGGVLLTLLKSLYHDIVAVFQPPSTPLNATVFDAILRYGKCTGCVLPPSLLEEMIAVPSYFDTLANLSFVQFGSGPLAKISGDTLLTRQQNCPHYIGSSEVGLLPLLELDDPVQDWQYFHFHPWSGVDMRPVSGDGKMFEMFVTRIDKKFPGLQPVFELFPDIDEWRTQDLYSKHPTKPGLWRSCGRNDDVLVLSNGEKVNPIEMEGLIANTVPSVVGALVVGQGRFMPGLLLEVKGVDVDDPGLRAKLVEEIWPSVEKANREAPKHAQLNKSLIMFTSPDKPFARTPKLSVRRGPTIQSYAEEIEEMYKKAESDLEASTDVDLPADINLDGFESVRDLLVYLLREMTGWKTLPSFDDDLFMFGFDSLLVLRMTRAIKLAISRYSSPGKANEISTRTVYNNPSINDLSKSILSLLSGDASNGDEGPRESKIEAMIGKFSDFKFSHATSSDFKNGTSSSRGWVVVLTGSTGSLGTYLLWTLLRDHRISTVYCLNRSSSAKKRQLEALSTQGLSIEPHEIDTRVKFLLTESLANPWLGLQDEDTYKSLLQSAPTHILHNAWPVNFNLNLASFESHIAGVRALVDFCAKIHAPKPHLFFVSSLSSVTMLSLNSNVPETVVHDLSAPSKMGYGESKYVAERLVNSATIASDGEIPSTILRVGQIAGPIGWNRTSDKTKGIWPTREWLPSLIISSRSVGAVPKTLGKMESVAWIPVDVLANIICEMMDTSEAGTASVPKDNSEQNGFHPDEARVCNLLNPNMISWQFDLLPTVLEKLQIDVSIPLSEWVQRIRDGPGEADATSPNPARKIIGFYEALITQDSLKSTEKESEPSSSGEKYNTGRTGSSSKSFRELGPVKQEWMATWMEQWGLSK